jgi:hypothetical protein
MMAMKAKIPTQVPMTVFLPMFVVSLAREHRSEAADELVSKRKTMLFARTNNRKIAIGTFHFRRRPMSVSFIAELVRFDVVRGSLDAAAWMTGLFERA